MMESSTELKQKSPEVRSASAHQDTFCADSLPPRELWPRMQCFGIPDFNYPARMNCAAELLDKMVQRGDGERIAIRSSPGHWTYRQLLENANKIAHVLVDDLGLVPGNRVLLRGANTPMLVASWFAVLKAGGVVVCTMPLLRVRELVYVAEKARISVALTDSCVAGDCEVAMRSTTNGSARARAQVVRFHAPDEIGSLESLMRGKPSTFNNCDTAADDVAIIAFTSGTTGRGKGTVHFHHDLMAASDCFSPFIVKPQENDIFIGSPPIAFTYGLGGLLLFPMRIGASTVLLEKTTAADLLQGIQDHRATICFTSPTGYRAMLKKLSDFDISSLRKCVSAGEALPLSTFEAWRDAAGLSIIDGIGSTEMVHMFISSSGNEIRPGATGKVIPGYEARLVDENGNDVPVGAVGRLAVRGPTGCRYLDDIEQQKKYVSDGWNFTGDSYIKDADGYFWYQSRTDEMIVSSGYNISGVEVENVLLDHPKVAECAVVAAPDDERGHIVKAFVVLSAGTRGDDALVRELQDFVKTQIAPYKYPRAIEFRQTLPRTHTGKLQRFKLRNERPEGQGTTVLLQPSEWQRPSGYANGIVARGRSVFVAGQVGWNPVSGKFESDDLASQVRQALHNVVAVLREAGAEPSQIVRLNWYIVDKGEYVNARERIGEVYRDMMGKHFPAMSMVVVKELMEDRARVEIEATAVIPD
jgi:2-aminobenzoate-CoA ligase